MSGLAALAWQAEPRLASEQVGEVLTRSAAGRGWNQFTGAGVADGMRAVEVARVYDVVSPRARRRACTGTEIACASTSSARATGRRAATSSPATCSYGLLVSRDGGSSFHVLASRRRRPFTKNVRIRGGRANVLVSTACDANGNCGVKRLGRFRRRG